MNEVYPFDNINARSLSNFNRIISLWLGEVLNWTMNWSCCNMHSSLRGFGVITQADYVGRRE